MPQILAIFFPITGVGENIIHKCLMFPIIMDDTLIIISLPEVVIKMRPILILYTFYVSIGC